MWVATAIALLGVLASTIAAIAALITAMRIHTEVGTVNGNHIGAVVEGIAKQVAPEALMNAEQVVASRDARDAKETKP